MDPTLCGLNGDPSWSGKEGTGESAPVVIPVICTVDDGPEDVGELAVAVWLSAVTCTFFSSDTEFTETSLTVAWKRCSLYLSSFHLNLKVKGSFESILNLRNAFEQVHEL